jgi:hypothetical protein
MIALYIVLFVGFVVYERVFEGKTRHFIPKSKVDLKSDAVWEPGEGDRVRELDLEESRRKRPSMKTAFSKVLTTANWS